MNSMSDIVAKLREEWRNNARGMAMEPKAYGIWYVETSEAAPGNIAIAKEQPHSGWTYLQPVNTNTDENGFIGELILYRVLGKLPILAI